MKMENDTLGLPELLPDEVLEILIALYPEAVAKAHRSYYRHKEFCYPLVGKHLTDHEACVRQIAEPLRLSAQEWRNLSGAPPLDCPCALCATLPPWKDRYKDLTGISSEAAQRSGAAKANWHEGLLAESNSASTAQAET
ncbi:MAG TPA: hypothetical protein VG796_28070 [Verrucomicrobiales bacterium]|nr:hypothetical protein [Verrucomicrobiales bacterium]